MTRLTSPLDTSFPTVCSEFVFCYMLHPANIMVDVLAIMDCFFFKTHLGFLMATGLSIQTDSRV